MKVKLQRAFAEIYDNSYFSYQNGASGNLTLILFNDNSMLLIGYIVVPANLNIWTPIAIMPIDTQYSFFVDKDNYLSTNVDRNYVATREKLNETGTVQIIASLK